MRKFLIIIAIILSVSSKSQMRDGDKIVLNNEAWNCGTGNNPDTATVVMYKKKMYVRFDFEQMGNPPVLWPLKMALLFWKEEGTQLKKLIQK